MSESTVSKFDKSISCNLENRMHPFEINGHYWNLDRLVSLKESAYDALTLEGEEMIRRFGGHSVLGPSGEPLRAYHAKRPKVVLLFPGGKHATILNVTAEMLLWHLGKSPVDGEKNVPSAPADWKPPKEVA